MPRQHLTGKLIDIEDKLPALREYFASQPEIEAAYLYGSYGTPFQTPLSDVDLALLLSKKISFKRELQISAKISMIAEEDDINVLILNDAPVVLQFNVIAAERVLYKRDADKVADFVEIVLTRYGDYQIDMAFFSREHFEGLKEAFRDGGQ